MMKCPNPNCANDQLIITQKFCDQCGEPLPEDWASNAQEYIPEEGSESEPVAGNPTPPVEPSGPEMPKPSAPEAASPSAVVSGLKRIPLIPSDGHEPANGIPAAEATAVVPEIDSDCEALVVEYNLARVFIEGVNFPFDFKITPQCDGLEKIQVEVLREESGQQHWHERSPTVAPRSQRGFEVAVNYCPRGFHGHLAYTVYISFHCKGKRECFERTTRHKVFPSQAKARDVIQTLIVNIKSEVGNASDPRINVYLDDLEKRKDSLAANDPISAYIDRYPLEPLHVPLSLLASNYQGRKSVRRVPQLTLPNNVKRLTLRKGRERLHVMVLPPEGLLGMGRNRTCEICARVIDHFGRLEKPASSLISGCHVTLNYSPAEVVLSDGDGDQPSTNHVWLDGIRIKAPIPLNMDEPQDLFLGGATETQAPVAYRVTPWSLEGVGRLVPRLPLDGHNRVQDLAALHVQKISGGSEHYLFLWHACALKPLGFGEGALVRHDLMTTDGAEVWLMPGMKMPGFAEWDVRELDLEFPPH